MRRYAPLFAPLNRNVGPRKWTEFLRWGVFLPGRRHAMDDSHPDPLRRRVEQVGTNRHADDEYDVSNDIYPERHQRHPKNRRPHRTRLGPFALCASTRIKTVPANVDRADTFQFEIAMNDVFDGTHQLISISAMPWVARGIYLP